MSLPRALAVVGFVTFLAAARGASSSPTSEPPPPTPLARMGGGINVTRLVADLDNDDFTEREKATMELAKRGRIVEAELRQAYEKQPSPEARFRLESLFAKLKDAPNEETAKGRAVQVLETIGAGEPTRA
jgi:hypothetical protein